MRFWSKFSEEDSIIILISKKVLNSIFIIRVIIARILMTKIKNLKKEISWKNHSPEDMPKVVFDTYFVEKSIHP